MRMRSVIARSPAHCQFREGRIRGSDSLRVSGILRFVFDARFAPCRQTFHRRFATDGNAPPSQRMPASFSSDGIGRSRAARRVWARLHRRWCRSSPHLLEFFFETLEHVEADRARPSTRGNLRRREIASGNSPSIANEVRPGCGGGGIFSSLCPHAPQQCEQRRRVGPQQLRQIDRAPRRTSTPKLAQRADGGAIIGRQRGAFAVERAEMLHTADSASRARARAGRRRCQVSRPQPCAMRAAVRGARRCALARHSSSRA